MKEDVLFRIFEVARGFNKRVLLVLVFGSSVYNPRRARDIDLIIVIDKLLDIREKVELEVAVRKALKEIDCRVIYDVLVFDIESFFENASPGAVISGVVAGYRVLHDEIGFEEIVEKIALSVLRDKPIIYKEGKRLGLALHAERLLRKPRSLIR